MSGGILVAGIGNVFLGDDGFGVEVAGRLATPSCPPGVRVADFGIRGVHLAYELLDGYDSLILIDAVPMGEPPGHAGRHRARADDPATRGRGRGGRRRPQHEPRRRPRHPGPPGRRPGPGVHRRLPARQPGRGDGAVSPVAAAVDRALTCAGSSSSTSCSTAEEGM